MSARCSRLLGLAALGAWFACAGVATASEAFSYSPSGELAADSGKGRADTNVYAPGIRFPLEKGPAFANSQVWGHGGNNGTGSQCDTENFAYPWRDNFCESRSWDMPLCPAGTGHQGQDIRGASCEKGVYATLAVADGTITNVGSYSVYLTTDDGTRFDYLHMQDVAVTVGQKVKRGDPMGKVSNVFGGDVTTVHLHFNIRQNVDGVGTVYVPPYMSLIKSYETLLGIGLPDAAPPPPAPPPPLAAILAEAPPAVEDDGCALAPASATTSGLGAGLALVAVAAMLARRARR